MFNFLHKIKDYIIIKNSGLFDEEYYCLQYPDVRRADVNPLWHFISIGWKERRNPSSLFDTNYYLNANKDVYEAGINPLTHYIRSGKEEGRSPIQLLTSNSVTVSVDNSVREKNLKKFFSYLQTNYPDIKNIKYIFFLPLFSTGGSELVAMNFIHFILNQINHKSVLMIITDTNKMNFSFQLPENLGAINLDNDIHIHDWEEKKVFVFDLINCLKPYAIHNINSSVFWSLLIEKGKKIQKSSKVYANIFCFQFDEKGKRSGYAEYYLQDALPYLDGLLSDNKRFLEDAKKVYNLRSASEKFHTVYNPFSNLVDSNLTIPQETGDRKSRETQQNTQLRCLWAGRLDEQKRYDFFFDIVENCNFCNFDMYGQAVIGTNPSIPTLPNLTYHGGYKSFSELLKQKNYDAFILTSLYEGLPNTLIEAGAWGLPIIAPNVGGIGELVNCETGYLLREDPTIDDYLDALREIQKNPELAKLKVSKMRKLIAERHNWNEFSKCVSLIPGYLSESE